MSETVTLPNLDIKKPNGIDMLKFEVLKLPTTNSTPYY